MRSILMMGLAGVLALIAFALNLYYLEQASKPVAYVRVKQPIAVGEILERRLLEPIDLPGDAKTALLSYDDVEMIIGRSAPRDIAEGELLLLQDVSEGRPSLLLDANEQGLVLPVNQLELDPGLVRVGDNVSFVVPAASASQAVPEQYERLGPFRVVALNAALRPEESDVLAKESQRIHSVTVAIRLGENGQLVPQAARLVEATSTGQIAGLLLSGDTSATVAWQVERRP